MVTPKAYVGTSGSVKASHLMTIRSERPDLFEVETENESDMDVRKIASAAYGSVTYYIQVRNEEDFKNVNKSKKHLEYEVLGIETLTSRLESVKCQTLPVLQKDIQQVHKNAVVMIKQQVSEVIDEGNSLKEALINDTGKHVSCMKSLKKSCHKLLAYIDSLKLPHVRPYVFQLTDAGPGVGVNNFEAQFRETELAMLHNSQLRHRVHLATDDQGHNIAERTNAYVGDAIADGSALKVDYFEMHHGLTQDDLNNMSNSEINDHENKMKEKNAWAVAEDVKNRIHDEPGPGKTFMSSFVSEKPHNLFFSNTEYLNAWRKAGKRQRPHLPGHNYFSLVDEIRQTHLEVGELYMEFSTCDSLDCPNNCVENPYPKIDPVPRPLPDSSTDHYKTYENTPSLGTDGKPRPIDDYQPRKQCTIQYEKGLIAIDKPTEIDSFCSKYLVKKNNVLEHLNHKAY